MKQIGNIITKSKKLDLGQLFNVVRDGEPLVKDVPTLIVGNELTKKLHPEYNIIDWQISKDTFWTFGLRERRQQYEQNIEDFKKLSLSFLKSKIKYIFINLFTMEKKEMCKFFKEMVKGEGVFYLYNNMCYYCNGEDVVLGISLTDLEYLGHDIKKFISFLYKTDKCKVFMAKDVDLEIKTLLQDAVYAIPYLLA